VLTDAAHIYKLRSGELVRAHGGQVGVDGSPGAGTTFTVTLPI